MLSGLSLLFVTKLILCIANFKESFGLDLLCNTYEERRICGTKCPITCDTLNTNVCCDATCVSGCFCKDGYMLVSNQGPRKCVPINDCPKPGILEFKDLTITVLESSTLVEIVVLRLNGSAGEVSVAWRTERGTALERSDFVPANGLLVFSDGVISRIITIVIIDDSVREPDELFSVILFDPTNKAEINPRISEGLRIIIKDDDMRPGYFEVENINITVPENYGTALVTLVRVQGQDGFISIRYKTVDGTARGQTDYAPVTGEVSFNEGERRKTIAIAIIDDTIWEPEETFQLQFFNPTVASDVINFKQLSSRLTTIVTIVDDDMKPGYIEMDLTTITVVEEIGTIKVNVVRLGGTDGEIRIQYRTVDGRALAKSDYVPVTGDVVFNSGEKEKSILVSIINDDVREPSENFQLLLFDPTTASSGVNSRSQNDHLATTIIIMDDDMKPGYLELEQVNITIKEDYGTLQVGIVRVGGTDGILQLKYKTVDVTATANSDYVAVLGDLVFQDGESKKTIDIVIVNDDVREPVETLQLQIFNFSAGSETLNFRALGTRLTALITIIDDDAKPGYVELSSAVVTVPESVGLISLSVVRKNGQDGEIRVRYKTVDGTATAPSDYTSRSGELVFREGVTLQQITIGIVNDDIREPTENFRLELFELPAVPDVSYFKSLGSKTSTIITIVDDDMKPGYLELEQVNITVRENHGILKVNVIRVGGTDGTLNLKYRSADVTATAQSDYLPVLGDFVFKEGESQKIIDIVILNDDIRESIETFQLEIFDFAAGSETINFRALGTRLIALITIIDDDDNAGAFEFKTVRLSVPESIRSLSLTIVRTDGSNGRVSLQLRTKSSTATEGVDYIPPPRTVIFPDGVTERSVQIQIVDDDIKETEENFLVGIFNPTNGGILGKNKMVIVVIVDDDDPSIIRFARRSGDFRKDLDFAEVPVIRENRLDRRTNVYWKTEDRSARAGQSYRGTSGTLITFEPRESRKTLRISALGNSQFESSDLFDVILFDPSEGAVLGTPSRYTVHLLDYNRGAASSVTARPSILSAPNGVQIAFSVLNIRVRENVGVVHISISRSGDTSPFTVKIRTADGSATAGMDYRRVSGSLSFKRGDSKIVIAVRILNDDVYEPEETFTVQLLEPSLGTVLPGMDVVTVTIEDDDDVEITPRRGSSDVEPAQPHSSGYGFLTKCPDHLILKECADTCPPTCSSLYDKAPCLYVGCIRGCFCPEGFVKESDSSDRCVKPIQCPGGAPPPRK